MGKNSIKNISLAAFVGLFAFYNFNSYNIRLDSVSSKGLVIKYSHRGLASTISCPPVSSPIDKTVADSLATETCRHHVESKELENGDIEYTVTAYYKGHISTGTKVFPAQEAAAQPEHNVDFIKSIVRASKKKFDEAPQADPQVALAQAETEEPEEEPITDSVTTTEEEKDETDNKPEITAPTVTASADGDDEDETEFDSEELMESIETYAELKIAYNSCSGMDKSEERKLKTLMRKYDRGLKKYLRLVDKYEDSEKEKTPLTRFVAKNESKLAEFMNAVDEFDAGDSDDEFDDEDDTDDVAAANTGSKTEHFKCLVKRSKSITDKKAQFAHYSQNIQPMLREAGQAGSIQEFEEFVQRVQTSPLNGLAQNNPYINASLQSDLLGAQTQARLADNTKKIAEAQKLPEPVKTNTLRVLNEERTAIKSDYELGLTEIAKHSPAEIHQDIAGSGQFWAQQMLPLEQLVAKDLADTDNTSDTTNASAKNPANDKVMQDLDALYQRIAKSKQGTGNSRRGAVVNRGQYNIDSQTYRGRSVPQVGDAVEEAGSVQ